MKTGLMTHRESFCTGTAKSVSRYDIYLEWIAVYRYIVAPLVVWSRTITPRCCERPDSLLYEALSIRVGVIKIVIVINCNLITFSKVIACNCN